MRVSESHFALGMDRSKSPHERAKGQARTIFNYELEMLTRLQTRREASEEHPIADISAGTTIVAIWEMRFDEAGREVFYAIVDDSGTKKLFTKHRNVGGDWGAWAERTDITVDTHATEDPLFLNGELATRILPRNRTASTQKVMYFRRYSANVTRFEKTADPVDTGQDFIFALAALPETSLLDVEEVCQQQRYVTGGRIRARLNQGLYRYMATWLLDDGQESLPIDDYHCSVELAAVTKDDYRRGIVVKVKIPGSPPTRAYGVNLYRAATYGEGYDPGTFSPYFYLGTALFDGSEAKKIKDLAACTVTDEGGFIKKISHAYISDFGDVGGSEEDLELDDFAVRYVDYDFCVSDSDVDADWIKVYDPENVLPTGSREISIMLNTPVVDSGDNMIIPFGDGWDFSYFDEADAVQGMQDLTANLDVYQFQGIPAGMTYVEVTPEVGCFAFDRFIGGNLEIHADTVEIRPHWLIAAELGKPDLHPLTSIYILNYDGGHDLLSVTPTRQGVLVLKGLSAVVMGLNPSNIGVVWSQGDVFWTDGLKALRSPKYNGLDTFWAGHKSIWRYNDTSGVIERIGKPVELIWNALTGAEKALAVGYFDIRLDRYILSVPLSTTTWSDILPVTMGLSDDHMCFEYYLAQPEIGRPAAWVISDREMDDAVLASDAEWYSARSDGIDKQDDSGASIASVLSLLEIGMPPNMGSMLVQEAAVLGKGDQVMVLCGDDDSFLLTDTTTFQKAGEWKGLEIGVHRGQPRVIFATKGDAYIDDVAVEVLPDRSPHDG